MSASSKKIINAVCVSALIAAVFCSASAWANQYEIIDLGTLGGISSHAIAIDDSCRITGDSANVDKKVHAFIWDNGVMTDLGTLGGDKSYGYGIYSGQVVGKSQNSDGTYRAFIWNQNDGMTDLGTLEGDTSYAQGINLFGQVAGYAPQTVDGDYHAFLWDKNDGMTDLGTLGGSRSYGYAINDLSYVVGKAKNSDNDYHAFLWNKNDGMIDLGTLGGSSSEALGINNSAQTVGISKNSDGDEHAVLWNNTEINDFGTLGGNKSEAYRINDAGLVVGTSKNSDGDYCAFLWKNNEMIDLNTLIVPDSGWKLQYAHDINNSGWIVGYGHDPNKNSRAFLLKPATEPQSLRGRVRTSDLHYDNAPIQNAKVSVAGTELSAQTNESGEFLILNVPLGTYTVNITADNFAPKSIDDFQVSANEDIELSDTEGSLSLSLNPLPGDANENNDIDLGDVVFILKSLINVE